MVKAKKAKTTKKGAKPKKKVAAKKVTSAKLKRLLKGGAVPSPGRSMYGQPWETMPKFQGGPGAVSRSGFFSSRFSGFSGGRGSSGSGAKRGRSGR